MFHKEGAKLFYRVAFTSIVLLLSDKLIDVILRKTVQIAAFFLCYYLQF
jgi:hypothetical protein